jgi:hypothetical protein
MRVINRVHHNTADMRPAAKPTTAARLADLDILLIRI